MIELKDVSLIRNGRVLLEKINWKLGTEENWILFGRNGSGKTLLLEIIAGYLFPTEGEVVRFGKSSGKYDIRELQKRIGYVSTFLKQMFSPVEKLVDVVASGIYASIGLYKTPSSEELEKAYKLLDSLGLYKRCNEQFGIFSDGEKQKVLLLRALINDPDLLILDEPALGLDLPSREDLLDAIETLNRIHKTSIIYVTHHTEEITSLFTSIMIIENGRVFHSSHLKNGLPEKVLEKLFNHEVEVVPINSRYYTLLR